VKLGELTLVIAAVTAGITPVLQAQIAVPDTLPAAVVQRFVDGANARQLEMMMSAVAPGAVFGPLPDNGLRITGRDSVEAHYARVLASMPEGYSIRVVSRIADGAYVTDLELFINADGSPAGRATWVYHVTHGQIQRAWVLRPSVTRRP
jgi:hypothetical protein